MKERDYQHIRVSHEGAVATLTLDNPARKNALGPGSVNELLWALDDAAADEGVRVVVLTGAGGVFSAGADLKQVGATTDLPARGDFADLLLRFTTLGKPTIARVPGYAMGGGLGLVASCDFAIACEDATVGTPEVKRGLWPMMIMAVLSRIVPRRKLLKMMLLGDRLSAAEALDHGLVTEVVPAGELDDAVAALAARLAAQSPTAMRVGLAAYHAQGDLSLAEALPFLRERFGELLASEDAREGLRAFAEKREPRWTGR